MSGRGKGTRGGARITNPKRSLDKSKAALDEEEEEVVVPTKKTNKGATETGTKKTNQSTTPAKKVNKQPPPKSDEDDEELDDEEDEEEIGLEEELDELEDEEDEGSEPPDSDESNPDEPAREFGPRSFVVLKIDFEKPGDPPLWRIDGNSLLQKFTPFKGSDGSILYKSTSVYSGWSINSKECYYPAAVTFKKQNKNDTIIYFDRSQIKTEK